MNFIECISLTAALTIIIQFGIGCFEGCYNNKEEEFKLLH